MQKLLGLLILGMATSPCPITAQDYEVTVSNVTVWIRAIDKSHQTVMGLTPDDFEVFEDGRKVDLTCFEAPAQVSSEDANAPPIENHQEEPQKIAFFLDLFNMSKQEYQELLPVMDDFLGLIPAGRKEITTVALTPEGKLRVLISATRAPKDVQSLLHRLPVETDREMQLQKNNIELAAILRDANEIPEMREAYLHRACLTARQFTEQEKQISTESLKVLDAYVKQLSEKEPDRQKIVIHISGGFNSDPGRAYFDVIEGLVKKWGDDVEKLYFQIPDCRRDLSFQPTRDVKNTMTGMNRSNVTLYSISTRSKYRGMNLLLQKATLTNNENSIMVDYKFFQQQMADQTGGLFFPNLKKFRSGLEEMLSDLENQYEVCFKPSADTANGKYHTIRVTTKKPGVLLRYRKGYVQ